MTEPQPDLRPRPGTRSRPPPATCAPAAAASKSISRTARVRYIEGNRDHPVNKGVICGKGCGRHHAALFAGPAVRSRCCGSASAAPANFAESNGRRRLRLATAWLSDVRSTDPSKLAFFTGRDQSQALDRLVGDAVRHAQLRRPWRLLLGQHGGRRALHLRRLVLGIRRARLEATPNTSCCSASPRTMPPTRSRSASASSRSAAPSSSRSTRSAPAIPPSPMNGSASAPAPTGCSSARSSMSCCKAGKVDLDYLRATPTRRGSSSATPGAADDGLFARDARAARWSSTAAMAAPGLAGDPQIRPALLARPTCPTAAAPCRSSSCGRALSRRLMPRPRPSPQRCGIAGRHHPAHRRRARRMPPSTQRSSSTCPGRTGPAAATTKMIGRPVAMHAMRGISAHSNGFQTCRTIHLLQIILGTIDVPGGFRYKPPIPARAAGGEAGRQAGRDQARSRRCPAAARLRHRARRICWSTPTARRCASTRPFPGKRRFAAHGLMHTVIANAGARDPYPIDVLFMFMANMSWNSAMNVGEHASPTSPTRIRRRRLPHPAHHLFRCLLLGDGRLCRSGPARHDLSRALGLHLAARPADLRCRRPGRCHPPAGGRARPRRAAVPGRADRSRRAARAARHDQRRWRAALPRRLCRLHGQPRAQPGHRPARRLARRATASDREAASPIHDQLERYIENGCFWPTSCRRTCATSHANRDYLDWAVAFGFIGRRRCRSSFSSTASRCRNSASPRRAMASSSRRRAPRAHRDAISIRCRSGTRRSRRRRSTTRTSRSTPITQRPMAMYHSWGSQNAWLRQIHRPQLALHGHRAAARAGPRRRRLGAGHSRHGRIEVPVKLMDGVNPDTVWTWNAIGKRPRRLGSGQSARSREGFPAQSSDRRTSARTRRRLPLCQLPIRSPARPPGTICASASRRRRRQAMSAAAISRSLPTGRFHPRRGRASRTAVA